MTPTCEICGNPAAEMVCDLQEVEPTRDEKGNLWGTYRPAERHYYCPRHARRPEVRGRDGKLIAPPDMDHLKRQAALYQSRGLDRGFF